MSAEWISLLSKIAHKVFSWSRKILPRIWLTGFMWHSSLVRHWQFSAVCLEGYNHGLSRPLVTPIIMSWKGPPGTWLAFWRQPLYQFQRYILPLVLHQAKYMPASDFRELSWQIGLRKLTMYKSVLNLCIWLKEIPIIGNSHTGISFINSSV